MLNSLIPKHEIEHQAIEQMEYWHNLPFLKQMAIMPDVHKGYSLPIGAVVLLEDVISPYAVGYDIGCGMLLYETNIHYKEILPDQKSMEDTYSKLMQQIPVGKNIHNNPKHEIAWFKPSIDFKAMGLGDVEYYVNRKLQHSLGTLGGGNHFVELGYNRNEHLCITIHCGSRNPGWQVGSAYMKLSEVVDKDLPNGCLHLNSYCGHAYNFDMNFMLTYALVNREHILQEVLQVLGLEYKPGLKLTNEVHNHAEKIEFGVLHRKGVTQADHGMLGVIPGNMRDGVYVTKGLGNEDYLWSASHGAGRKGSRNWAKKTIQLVDFQDSMRDVVGTVNERTLDESPFAYKDLDTVMRAQQGVVVDIIDYVKPLINVKG